MKLFISYAKRDTRQLALQLADELNKIDGVTTWVDRSLRAGSSWELQIQAEIDKCDTMIVLYSPDINRHKNGQEESYVLSEITYAKRIAKKPILPVMAQKTDPPLSLVMEHYIDFTLEGLTLDDLIAALCGEMGIEIKPQANITSDSPAPTKQPPAPTKPQPAASADAVRRIIGDPFEWCDVPAGEFIYQDNQKLTLPAFAIAKYPITYRQFEAFISAKDGFKDSRWWEGLAKNQSDAPDDQRWKIDDHPREHVSWYDAMAFCRWLSFKLGGGFNIDRVSDWLVRLPTEFEWEKAARGTDGRIYPYGNNFDESKCNTNASDISRTTQVTQYPQGISPYGALDMCGNVWNWCLTNYQNPVSDASDENLRSKDNRVLRGGAYNDFPENTRTTFRNHSYPFRRNFDYGFRLMCVSTS